MGVGIMRDETLKRRDLNVSYTLVEWVKHTVSLVVVTGYKRDRRLGQIRKKPKDLSVCHREERGCGEGGGVSVVVVFPLRVYLNTSVRLFAAV
jgi:hypothetical protein